MELHTGGSYARSFLGGVRLCSKGFGFGYAYSMHDGPAFRPASSARRGVGLGPTMTYERTGRLTRERISRHKAPEARQPECCREGVLSKAAAALSRPAEKQMSWKEGSHYEVSRPGVRQLERGSAGPARGCLIMSAIGKIRTGRPKYATLTKSSNTRRRTVSGSRGISGAPEYEHDANERTITSMVYPRLGHDILQDWPVQREKTIAAASEG